MKPFNLKEYLADPTKRVVTKDSRPVRIICTDAKGICPVVGLVAYENYELAFNVMKDGRIDGILDFFFAPEKHEGWQNIYKLEDGNMIGSIVWSTKEEAERNANTSPTSLIKLVATIKVEWEE